MSSGKAFPPRLCITATTLFNLTRGYSGNCRPIDKFINYPDDETYLSLREHSALLAEKDREIERLKEINSKFKFWGTDGCTKCETGRITLYYATNDCILCKQKEALAGGEDG